MIGLLAVGLGACGDDDDEAGQDTTTTAAEATGPNVLTIKETDYAFTVEGQAREGWLTFDVENTGKEFHMVAVAKLKAGKTMTDVTKLVQQMSQQGGPGGPGGGAGATTTTGGRATTTAQGGSTIPGGGEGEEEEDPFSEFFEEEEIGIPGSYQIPGSRVRVTTDALEPGNYGMMCFIPTEGEGVPHAFKGMIAGFEISEARTPAPEPTETAQTFTINKGKAPTGPATVPAGDVTFKVNADNGEHEFGAFELKPGQTKASVDRYFEQIFEGESPPPAGSVARAPLSYFASTFDFESPRTFYVTLTLDRGTYQIGCPIIENDDDEDKGNDIDHADTEIMTLRVT